MATMSSIPAFSNAARNTLTRSSVNADRSTASNLAYNTDKKRSEMVREVGMRESKSSYLHSTSLYAREVENRIDKTQQTRGIALHDAEAFTVHRGKRTDCICD